MSVSLFRWTEDCDQDPMCVGDCDLCRKEVMEDKYNEAGIPVEIEADGFITRFETLERINANKAKPIKGCAFPKCEGCDDYHGEHCAVPMVISKQIWLTMESLITRMEKRLTELETLVTDEILGSKPRMSNKPETNYTWDDYFKREDK